MAKLINLQPNKTYATPDNVIKAVEKKYPAERDDNLRYIIYRDEASGRYYPVFIGERALQAMVHFNFHVVA